MSLLYLQDFTQLVIDGVMDGSTYALIGIGFTLIFGLMPKINLSYAAASIVAAYLSLLVVHTTPALLGVAAPAALVCIAAAVLGGVLGALVHFVCFRFLPLDEPLATLIERQHPQRHRRREAPRCSQWQHADAQTRLDGAAHGLEAAHLHPQRDRPLQLGSACGEQPGARAAALQADKIAVEHVGEAIDFPSSGSSSRIPAARWSRR